MEKQGEYRATKYTKKGDVNRKQECLNLLKSCYPQERIVKNCMRGGVMYAAMRNDFKTIARIVVLSVNRKKLFNVFYFIYSEDECPTQYIKCYDEVLNCLSDTTTSNASKWRSLCREYNHLSREVEQLHSLPIGTKIIVNWNFGTRVLTKTLKKPLVKPIWYDGYYRYDPISILKNGYELENISR